MAMASMHRIYLIEHKEVHNSFHEFSVPRKLGSNRHNIFVTENVRFYTGGTVAGIFRRHAMYVAVFFVHLLGKTFSTYKFSKNMSIVKTMISLRIDKFGQKNDKSMSKNEGLLNEAMRCWYGLEGFRRERERNKRFTYGDQWGDLVPVDGEMMKEEDYIRSQGNLPLKNNLIRRLVRNVLGVFRDRWQMPRYEASEEDGIADVAKIQRLLEMNMGINRMDELYARTMEEFLISGLVIHRKWYGNRSGRNGCWTEFVQPDNFFCDTDSRDFRGWDGNIVGEIHEMSFQALCSEFSGSAEDVALMRRYYPAEESESGASGNRCKVIEVWKRTYKGRYKCHDKETGRYYMLAEGDEPDSPNVTRRWIVEEVWECWYLTPEGDVLRHEKSPYRHGGHPYVYKAYPFIDGEIHSFVSDIIDQQKFTNRLISMYDWVLRASAKGVLLFPEGCLPQGSDINDVAEEWGRFNGVIVYRPKVGVPLPQQLNSNSAQHGIAELLDIQMKMMEDISGVNGALQGKLDSNSISGTLYNQQTKNSLTALADLLKSFDGFIKDGTEMDISNIRQFILKF